jgi:exodeoxyribonuclease VII large subunit
MRSLPSKPGWSVTSKKKKMSSDLVLSVSDFVAVFNQTLEYAYPIVTVQGELANFRVSKNRWVYFDLKDEFASVKFFGTVYQLPGPLEDGLLLQVSGSPRLHPLYGFSINVQAMQPVGEGSIKRAMALLEAKLAKEGLFDESRKRPLPYPPRRIGLITSGESAAYHDFIKIMKERWGGVEIELADVQVQGEASPGQLIAALEYFNTHEDPVEVIVMTRGGGSPEDLGAFSTEQVTRAVAASRIPTLVAIGHEVDISLAELAADQRASTPSNAAQLLVPDKLHQLAQIGGIQTSLGQYLQRTVSDAQAQLATNVDELTVVMKQHIEELKQTLSLRHQVLTALSPTAALQRGYAIILKDSKAVRSAKDLITDDIIEVKLHDGDVKAKVQ